MNNPSIPSKQQPYNHNSFSKISRPSTALQSWWFLKKYLELSVKVEKVNDCSIPSTHAEEKLPIFLLNTLILHIPLLALTYPLTEKQTEKQIHLLRMGWKNFFSVVLLCQFLVLAGNRFWFYILMYLEYNTVVVLC